MPFSIEEKGVGAWNYKGKESSSQDDEVNGIQVFAESVTNDREDSDPIGLVGFLPMHQS